MSGANLEAFGGVTVKPPSENEWNAQAARQRREMGGTVDQVFSSQNMGEAVHRLHQKRNEEQRRLSRMVFKKATVINLMPFPLNVNGVLHARLAGPDGNQIPECPVGQPFERKVIAELQWSIRDDGTGMDNVDNYTPVPCTPTELADDYAHEFLDRLGVGGVIVCEGDEDPGTPEMKKKLEEARRTRTEEHHRAASQGGRGPAARKDPQASARVAAGHQCRRRRVARSVSGMRRGQRPQGVCVQRVPLCLQTH